MILIVYNLSKTLQLHPLFLMHFYLYQLQNEIALIQAIFLSCMVELTMHQLKWSSRFFDLYPGQSHNKTFDSSLRPGRDVSASPVCPIIKFGNYKTKLGFESIYDDDILH